MKGLFWKLQLDKLPCDWVFLSRNFIISIIELLVVESLFVLLYVVAVAEDFHSGL